MKLFRLYPAPSSAIASNVPGVPAESFETRIRPAILLGRVYFSSPIDFNDPYDCSPVVKPGLTPKDEAIIRGRIQRARPFASSSERASMNENYRRGFLDHDSAQDNWRKIASQFGVVCFTERYDSPAMWAHYGANYRGLCIEYELDVEAAVHKERPQRVNYEAERPELTPTEILQPYTNEAKEWPVIQKAFFTKSLDWAYEKEWRLVTPRTRFTHDLGRKRVISITVGWNANPADKAWVASLALSQTDPLLVHEAVRHPHKFVVSRSLISSRDLNGWVSK